MARNSDDLLRDILQGASDGAEYVSVIEYVTFVALPRGMLERQRCGHAGRGTVPQAGPCRRDRFLADRRPVQRRLQRSQADPEVTCRTISAPYETRSDPERDRRMRGQLRAQERQIQMLQRAGVATASAEILRMRAKVDDLCRERDASRKAESEVERRTGTCDLLRVGKRKVNDSVHQIAEIRGLTFAHGLFKGGLRAPPCGQGSGMRSVTQLCDGNDPFPPVSFAD